MFRNNDKMTLSLVNARDIEGNIFPISLKFPINISEMNFPQNIVAIDVFEYHEGLVNGGSIVFSIYVGEKSTIEDLLLELNNIVFFETVELSSIQAPVCFKRVADKKIVFAALNEQDIVVENLEQLVMIIEKLSNEYTTLNNSVTRIRSLSKKEN